MPRPRPIRRWLVQAALLGWPATLRNRHRRALSQTVATSWDVEANRSRAPRRWWRQVALILDMLHSGLAERRDARRRSRLPAYERSSLMWRGLWTELRTASRTLVTRPAFTAGVVLTLSFGIGATTAIFSVTYGVLFRPLPFGDPDRLVVIWESNPGQDLPFMTVAPPNLQDWREAASTFADIAAFSSTDGTTQTPAGGERLRLARVTANLLDVLQVTPLFGRSFVEADGAAGAAAVMLLAESTWRRLFEADPTVVGRAVDVNGTPTEIVGVMPASFVFPLPIVRDVAEHTDPAEALIAYRADQLGGRTSHYLRAIGRLRPDVPLGTAAEQLRAIALRLEQQYPDSNAGWTVRLVPLADEVTQSVRPALLALFGAVGLVLLLACTNAAHLMLARALNRGREVAVRVALGAGRARLARQFLAEGLVLAAVSVVGGLVLASWAIRGLVSLAPATIPRLDEVRLDGWTLTAAIVAGVMAAVLSSLAPIVHAWRSRTMLALRDRSVASTRGGRVAHGVVVVGESAMAIVLVVMASLLGRSVLELRGIDPGFRPDDVLLFHTTLIGPPFDAADARTTFIETALERLGALPGVEQAGTVDAAPLAGDRQGTSFVIEGAPPFAPGVEPIMNFSFVSPGYFEAMGVRLLEGRTFTAADRAGSEPVVIINESFAREFFADGTALNRRVFLGFNSQTARRIVGVVRDEQHEALDGALRAGTYTPVYQVATRELAFVIRTSGDPSGLVTPVRETMRALDPRLAVYDIRPMSDVVSASFGTSRFATELIAIFAALALGLAVAGVFAVANHGVASRTVEIGVRVALGAAPRDVRRAVVRPTLLLAGIGAAVGLVVAAGLAQLLDQLLYNVSAVDPAAYAVAAGLVLLAALGATWLPARRAARIDPLQALRQE